MKFSSTYLLALLALCCFSSCEDDDDVVTTMLDVPASYTFLRDGASTVSFSGQTTRIAMGGELLDGLKDFDKSAEDLNNMFRNPEGVDPFVSADLNAATKSLRSKVAASDVLFSANASLSAAIRADFDQWITAQVTEVFPARNDLAASGQPGQIADGSSVRYVNAGGLEYNQAIAKGLIGALMYDQIVNNYLSPTVLDGSNRRAANDAGTLEEGKPYTGMEHRWDEAYGYLFGAAANPTAPLADLGTADDFLNKYLGRMEADPDYAGIAAATEQAFRRGRAAIVAKDYAERDAQASIIAENLKKVIAVRAVYYLMQGKTKLETTPVDFGDAFHDLSEGYGFIYSTRFLNDGSVDFEAKADGYLATLRNASGNGFWDIDPTALETIAASIAADTGISVAEAAN